jgi:hypothetical protein
LSLEAQSLNRISNAKENSMNRTIATLSFAIVLAFTSFAASAQTQLISADLSKQQLVSLIASAKTPAEHIRIAQYYGAKAQDYLAQSNEHAQMAEQFKENSLTSSPKFSFGTVNHCEYLAQSFKQKAERMQKLEQLHEQMAKDAEQR